MLAMAEAQVRTNGLPPSRSAGPVHNSTGSHDKSTCQLDRVPKKRLDVALCYLTLVITRRIKMWPLILLVASEEKVVADDAKVDLVYFSASCAGGGARPLSVRGD